MARSKRDQLLDRYEKEIRNVMARTLWVTAYADYAENLSEDEREEQGIEVARGGKNWEDVAPETPPAAHHAARDLAELFGQSEKVGRRRPMLTLYELAMHADTGEAPELEHMFGDVSPGRQQERGIARIQWSRFASDMVMEALGTGVSWFDDHEEFELAMPRFECHYDGTELMWSGTAAQGWDEGHVHTSYAEHGFDLTDFQKDGFESVLRGLGITVKPGKKLLVYTGPTGAKSYAWYWKGKGIEIVTGNDPITGEYALLGGRNREKDYASYMGIRGTPAKVTKAVELIRQFAHSIKGENPNELEFIGFGEGSGGPPELRKNALRNSMPPPPVKVGAWVRVTPDDGRPYNGEVTAVWEPTVLTPHGSANVLRDQGSMMVGVPLQNIALAGRSNPAGRFTNKGERMYQDIKAEYEAKGDPRAAEIAARTVYARAHEGASGLLNVGMGTPPGVPRRNSCGGR